MPKNFFWGKSSHTTPCASKIWANFFSIPNFGGKVVTKLVVFWKNVQKMVSKIFSDLNLVITLTPKKFFCYFFAFSWCPFSIKKNCETLSILRSPISLYPFSLETNIYFRKLISFRDHRKDKLFYCFGRDKLWISQIYLMSHTFLDIINIFNYQEILFVLKKGQ